MTELVQTLTLMFIISSILLVALEKTSHPSIPAYIISGLVISHLVNPQNFLLYSQIGISFLIFIFGLKLEPERFSKIIKESQITTTLQLSLIGSLGLLTGIILNLTLLESFFFGIATALSSSLVGLRLMKEELDLNLVHGRLSESIHLLQDLMAISLIMVLSVEIATPFNLLKSILTGIMIIFLGFIFREHFFPHIAKIAKESRELMMFKALGILVLFTGLSYYTNTSLIIGSFSAGIAVAKFPYNIEILDSISPIKDFFSAIFFISIGALVGKITLNSLLIGLTAFILVSIIKPALTFFSLNYLGYDTRSAILTGINMEQISEFSLIIFIQAFIQNTISNQLFHGVILAASATMVLSSYTSRHQEEIYNKISNNKWIKPLLKQIEPTKNINNNLSNHVILIGYDMLGKTLIDVLIEENQSFIVIENDPEKIEELEEKNHQYIHGDVMDDEIWDISNYRDAKLIISTVPVLKISEKILEKEKPDRILRSRKTEEAATLLNKGADYVIIPKFLSAEQMIEHLNGILEVKHYREELRRKDMLEVRRYLENNE